MRYKKKPKKTFESEYLEYMSELIRQLITARTIKSDAYTEVTRIKTAEKIKKIALKYIGK